MTKITIEIGDYVELIFAAGGLRVSGTLRGLVVGYGAPMTAMSDKVRVKWDTYENILHYPFGRLKVLSKKSDS